MEFEKLTLEVVEEAKKTSRLQFEDGTFFTYDPDTRYWTFHDDEGESPAAITPDLCSARPGNTFLVKKRGRWFWFYGSKCKEVSSDFADGARIIANCNVPGVEIGDI